MNFPVAPGLGALLLLGVLQGLTEFLPVSSSGHLVLAREWMGLDGDGNLVREVALHVGTLVAVVLFCHRDLLAMLRGGSAGLWRLVVGSTLVTGVIGIALEHPIETSLNDLRSAGTGLLVTSLLLILVAPGERRQGRRALEVGTWRDGVILGLFQSLALVPGISRAGSTIVGGLLLGFARPDAVRMAFLMSIPVVAGAVLLKFLEGRGVEALATPEMGLAVLTSALMGLLALRVMRVSNSPAALRRFGLYTLVLGVVALIDS